MPFAQRKNIMNRMNKIVGFFLAVSIVAGVAGCIPSQTKKIQTTEQIETSSATSDKNAAITGVRQISSISVELDKQPIEIKIKGNQKLVFTSIKQPFPFGIAIYFPETRIAKDFKMTIPENSSIGDLIVTYVDDEKTSAKVEILLNQDLHYEVLEKDHVLTISLLENRVENQTLADKSSDPTGVDTDQDFKKDPAPTPPVNIPEKTARMSHIEFNSREDGKTAIVVQTDQPVKYDVTHDYDNNKLFLNLYNTIIPEYHKRPLLTKYFKSAVEGLLPVQIPGEKKNSKIEIRIRDHVPYRIVQKKNIVTLHFEPSAVDPPVFHKANIKLNNGSQSQIIGTAKLENNSNEKHGLIKDKKQTEDESIFGSQKKYSGEKIKLDFYETDIKNVFRILRSVGKLNFAIDRDVQGKVTLTLEDPVPWDQVLDLVLRMNNLGMKKMGNVIRIATIETLNKEEKMMQETIVTRQKSLEQKKNLEPLVTEYIPVNYSDAEIDIKPHLVQILSKARGRISVDERTNMIIITDTQAKIDQAMEIIFRLDKVTP